MVVVIIHPFLNATSHVPYVLENEISVSCPFLYIKSSFHSNGTQHMYMSTSTHIFLQVKSKVIYFYLIRKLLAPFPLYHIQRAFNLFKRILTNRSVSFSSFNRIIPSQNLPIAHSSFPIAHYSLLIIHCSLPLTRQIPALLLIKQTGIQQKRTNKSNN